MADLPTEEEEKELIATLKRGINLRKRKTVNAVLLRDKLSCIHSREYTLFRFSAYGFPY